jgi:hypothetical protein
VKVSPSGDESFEAWRESVHDDPVLATALAVWQTENRVLPACHVDLGLHGRIQVLHIRVNA